MEAHKLARNFLSVFMALVLVVGFYPYTAYADESSTSESNNPEETTAGGSASSTETNEIIDLSSVNVKTTSFTYNGKTQTLELTNVPAGVNYSWAGTHQAKDAGTYNAEVTFNANGYELTGLSGNKLSVSWKINPVALQVSSIGTQTYNKEGVTPKVTVKALGTTLKSGTDYTVTYSNNKKVGTAKATVTPKSSNYKNATVSFKIQYKITYKLNGGKNSSKNPTYYQSKVTLKNPTKKGYTFKGWYTNKNFTSKSKVTSVTSGNKTLYAKWKKNTYKITYKLNGGKNSSKNPSKYTVTTSTIKLKNPSRSGYAFKGWYSDKALTKKVTSIAKGSTGSKTLYAKWKKLSATQAMQYKANSYSSNTKYLILVNCSTHKVGIYKGKKGSWTNIKYWSCTTGKSSTPTKKGVFTVKSKGLAFGSGYTCWYYTQFYGNYLFHSVLYQPGSKTRLKDGRLGISASHGCVRLSISNAKWIYKNIPRGTKVVIY